MKRETAEEIIKGVKESFDLIAEDFSTTRERLWEDLKFLFDYLKKGDKVLDLGCGNGRFYPWFQEKGVAYVGIDFSSSLIEIAKKKFPEGKFYLGNALELPFKNNEFDVLFAIALLHHIPSNELRLKVILEAKRVLKKKGILVLTVWNLWQKRYFKYILSEFKKKILGKSELDFKDCYIPWNKGEVKVQRYCHAFTLRELKKLIIKSDFKLISSGYTRRKGYRPNIYVVAKKSL
jgi:alkylated DNA repair protein alkB family protein 8